MLATSNLRYPVLCLQSLRCTYPNLPRISGYQYPPGVSNTTGPIQTATYVLENHTYTKEKSPYNNIPDGFYSNNIKITINNNQTNILNVYLPRGYLNSHKPGWLTALPANETWVVMGDFNAHHPVWEPDCGQQLGGGDKLLTDIMESNLALLNDGTKTRFPDRETDRPTAIDLTLVSPRLLSSNYEWQPLVDPLGSDHKPIITKFNVTFQTQEAPPPRYILEKADWSTFQSILNTVQIETIQSPDLETFYDNIRKTILQAADLSIPKTSGKRGKTIIHNNPWWNKECEAAVKEKHQASNRFNKYPTKENFHKKRNAEKHSKKTVAKAKLQHFNEAKITTCRDLGTAWKQLKKIKMGGRNNEPRLLYNNKVTQSNLETAEALAETFASASQTERLAPTEQARRNQVPLGEKSSNNDHVVNAPLKMSELNLILKSIKKTNKATGPDPISYKIIQKLPHSFLKILLKLYSRCWMEGEVPRAWKEAEVIGIYKPGKPRRDPKSFRPISLTPHLGKIYERIIKGRLEYFLNKNTIIPHFQAGFRPHRSCMEQVVKLTSHVRKAFLKKRRVFATFFDIKGAYDTVWHGRLLQKIRKIGIEGRLYNFIHTFLQNRTLTVRVGQSVSKKHHIDMGVPQGSIVAPTLFNIMLHDIRKVTLKDKHISMYADDIATWTLAPKARSPNTPKVLRQHQEKTDNIINYLYENGFTLSTEKCEFMLFSNGGNQQETLQMLNTVKQPAKKIKFLGVVLTPTLAWGEHIKHLVGKANKALNFIKIISKEQWAKDPKTICTLIHSLIRSRLTYGMEAYYTLPSTLLDRLQSVETKALKTALGLPHYAINRLVYRDIGWLPLKNLIKLNSAKLLIRTFAAAEDTAENFVKDLQGLYTNYINLLPHKAKRYDKMEDIINFTKNLFQEAKIELGDISTHSTLTYPRWQLQEADFDVTLQEQYVKEEINLITVAAKEKIETLKDHLQVYTDGSKIENKVGCAFTIPALKITKKFKLNDRISIFSAELWAILESCIYLHNLQYVPQRVIIFTDSLSSIKALQGRNNNRKDLLAEIRLWLHQIKAKGTDISLVWIPSHVGIRGNDMADQAAKDAALGHSAMRTQINLSITEASGILRNSAFREWDMELKAYAEHSSRDGCRVKGGLFPPIHIPTLSLIWRLRTEAIRTKFNPVNCPCGETISVNHLFNLCQHLQEEMLPFLQYLQSIGITYSKQNILFLNTGDWSPLLRFAETLQLSSVGHYF